MGDDLADLRARAERGDPLTQAEVARLLGLRRQTVHAIEQRALGKLRILLGRADTADIPTAMPKREPIRHPPRPQSDRYREQHGVIVLCKDEREQRAVYERLKGDGLKVRVVVT